MADDTTAAEEKIKKKYGNLPTQKDLLAKRMKGGTGKSHFDSADWAQDLNKQNPPAGVGPADAPPGGSVGPSLAPGEPMMPPHPESKS